VAGVSPAPELAVVPGTAVVGGGVVPDVGGGSVGVGGGSVGVGGGGVVWAGASALVAAEA
jgi:hypothetical protein